MYIHLLDIIDLSHVNIRFFAFLNIFFLISFVESLQSFSSFILSIEIS